jgi:hypothetical protein
MSKQTAVEWLEQEFIALQNYSVNELGLFLKAKEMDKKQSIERLTTHLQILTDKLIEDYYNKTFNK